MALDKNLIKSTSKNLLSIFYFSIGLFIATPLIFIYILLTILAIIYRLFVTKLLVKTPLAPTGLTKTVSSGFGTHYATEYITSVSASPPRPTRNTAVDRIFVRGKIPVEELRELVINGWLLAKKENGCVKYPELQQYIIQWMGYLFWKNDSNFDLNNHLKLYICPSQDFNEYTNQMAEQVLNMPFEKKKSPWDIHMIHSCNCPSENSNQPEIFNEPTFCQKCGKEENSYILIRIHHSLGDGFTILFAVVENLFGNRLIDTTNKNPNNMERVYQSLASSEKAKKLFWTVVLQNLKIGHFVRLFYDLGFIVVFVLFRANVNTPIHIPDRKKKWEQFTHRTDPISVEKLKQIKNHFGVSLTSVFMTCCSSAVAKRLAIMQGEKGKTPKNYLWAAPVPLPGHPVDQFINMLTFVFYKIPMNPNMDCVDRLMACNKTMKQVNSSLVAQLLFPWLVKLLSYHISPIAKFGFSNRMTACGLSNLATPGGRPYFVNGKYPMTDMDFTCGGNEGVTGTIFFISPYNENIRIVSTVDQAVMSRQELHEMLDDILHELHELQKRMQDTKTTTLLY